MVFTSVLIPYASADTVYCSYILMHLQYSDTGIYFYYTDYLNYYICSEVTKCKGPVKLIIYRLPVQTDHAGWGEWPFHYKRVAESSLSLKDW